MLIPNGSAVGEGEFKSWYYAYQEPETGLQWQTANFQFFHKPDVKHSNPKVNGYRSPSPWSGAQSEIVAVATLKDIDMYEPNSGHFIKCSGSVGLTSKSLPYGDPPNPNNVRMKILNNIRSEVLDVAMVLAEMQGTVSTLSGNLLRLGRSMQAIKNRKPVHFDFLMHGRRPPNLRGRRADKFNREVAGTYLEWKYGIMPTVYDIQGACKALDMNEEGSLFDNPPLLVARSSDKTVKNVSIPMVGNAVYFGVSGAIPAQLITEVKARCDYRVDGEGLRGLNRYGLGLGTVGTVLFERTPFSFVLNMAFPLAELIKAWTALAGVDCISYCETSYRKLKQTGAGTMEGHYMVPITGRIIGEAEAMRFERSVYPRPPFPIPFVRNPIKTGNVATVLSLFTSLRKPRTTKLDSFHF